MSEIIAKITPINDSYNFIIITFYKSNTSIWVSKDIKTDEIKQKIFYL